MERVWQRHYANHTEAKNDVADYIVSFYNCERLNSALGNLPPTVYERKMALKNPMEVSKITRPPHAFQDASAGQLLAHGPSAARRAGTKRKSR